MANKIGLIVKYSTEMFDKVYKTESRSSLLDGNKKGLTFTGAKTVKIPKFTATGLSDYHRANANVNGDFPGSTGTTTSGYGYQNADMGYEWEEFTLSCDRGAQYRVELFDNEETAEQLVGIATTEINRTVVIPEIDAYCFSRIAKYALADGVNTTAIDATNTPLKALNAGLLYFDNLEVPAEDQIIFAAPTFLQSLRNDSGLVKYLNQSEMKKNVSFLIEEYEGRPIVMVPPARFYTDVVLGARGYTKGASSAKIDFMIVAKSAVYHIVKYNKIKVFGPDVVQDYDGYKINARIYHDVFVPDNKRVAIYVHTSTFDAAAAQLAPVVNLTVDTKSTAAGTVVVTGAAVVPGDKLYGGLFHVAGTETVTVGSSKPASAEAIALGLAFATASGGDIIFLCDKDGKVIWSSGTTKYKHS